METILDTPLSKEKIDDLKAGDVVYISGTIFTARDRAHNRIIQEGAPYDLEGSVIFHAGPIIKMEDAVDKSDDLDMPNAKMIAVGPTTSTQNESFPIRGY